MSQLFSIQETSYFAMRDTDKKPVANLAANAFLLYIEGQFVYGNTMNVLGHLKSRGAQFNERRLR